MVLTLKTVKGTKNLQHALNFYEDPNLVTNKGIRTMLGDESYRIEVLQNSFKNLEKEDVHPLIDYIKAKPKIMDEYLKAFKAYKNVDNKKEISQFLYGISENTYEEEFKNKGLKLIFENDFMFYLNLINDISNKDIKLKLCKIGYEAYPERAYIFSILGGIDLESEYNYDIKKLIDEINTIEKVDSRQILKLIIENYPNKEEIIETIYEQIEEMELDMYYTLSKNIDVLNGYKLDVYIKEVEFIALILGPKSGKSERIIKEHMENHTTQWLRDVSIKLLEMEGEPQRLGIIIMVYLMKREGFSDKYEDIIFNAIYPVIFNNRAMRGELYKILFQLNVDKALKVIKELLDEEGLRIVRNINISEYLENNLEYIPEYKWYYEIQKSKEYSKYEGKLDEKFLAFILQLESPKAIYNFMKDIKAKDEELHKKIMVLFENMIFIRIGKYEKILNLLIIMEHQCVNKSIENEIIKYKNENEGLIEAIKKEIAPELVMDGYINKIDNILENKNYENAVELVGKISDKEIKNQISIYIVDRLIKNNNINGLSILWEKIPLDVVNQSKYGELTIKRIKNGQVNLNKNIILLADKLGMDPVDLFSLINKIEDQDMVIDIWYKLGDIGKITTVLKNRITNNNNLNELNKVKDTLEKYNIRDHSIEFLIKIKSYTSLSIMLLDLDSNDENLVDSLNNILEDITTLGLIDRFLKDKLLHEELGRDIVDYMVRILMENETSNDLLIYYWEELISDYKINKYTSGDKMQTFISLIFKSKERIEWLLDFIYKHELPEGMYLTLLESILILLNNHHRMNMQSLREQKNILSKILNNIGSKISLPITNLEKAIVSGSSNGCNDVLIENMKKLRMGLKEIGIGTVEDIERYGSIVDKDNSKHQAIRADSEEVGLVDSLGLTIGESILSFASLLNNK